MTGAEFRTLRDACGLSRRDAADFLGVAERTISHWESQRNAIPAGVADELRRLDARIERAVIETIELVEDVRARHGPPETIALTRYRAPAEYASSRPGREGLPHGAHNALLARTRAALERIGQPVRITWAGEEPTP